MSQTRRDFLKYLSLTGAALGVPGVATGAPHLSAGRESVAVTGRVTGPDGGLEGVPVTDGVAVTQTGPDGRYELAASPRRPFVYISVPSGYRLPTHETGTARFYRPLGAAGGGTAEASFRLTPLDRDDEQHAFLFLADPQTRTAAEMRGGHPLCAAKGRGPPGSESPEKATITLR